MLKQLENLPTDEGVAALTVAVDAVEHELDNSAAIGQAWASGNLRKLREAQGRSANIIDLLTMTPTGHVLASRAEDDLVKSINTALETPGVAVTTFDINRFAERGGAER